MRGLNPCLNLAINTVASFFILSASDDSAPGGGCGLVEGGTGGGWPTCPEPGGRDSSDDSSDDCHPSNSHDSSDSIEPAESE